MNIHTAYISIGSNLGNRKNNIRLAIKKLMGFCNIEAYSRVYRTKPYGVTDQPDFINLAVRVSTILEPAELLEELKAVEDSLGRVRIIRWGPRTIDLDILFFDDLIIKTENLTIPHPDLQNRYFVLKPLNDISPDYIHPVIKLTVAEMFRQIKKTYSFPI